MRKFSLFLIWLTIISALLFLSSAISMSTVFNKVVDCEMTPIAQVVTSSDASQYLYKSRFKCNGIPDFIKNEKSNTQLTINEKYLIVTKFNTRQKDVDTLFDLFILSFGILVIQICIYSIVPWNKENQS